MSKQDITLKQEGPIATLSICRSEQKNTLTPAVLSAISSTIDALTGEDMARVLIIRGEGDRIFSAGYDISLLPEGTPDATVEQDPMASPLEQTLHAIEVFPYPTIAMLNGHAFGGGCELAVACDLRIAADHIKMGMPPVKLGMVYPYPGFRRFMRVLGFAAALEVFLTARTYDSRNCLQRGLVHEVVEARKLESYTGDLAETMAGHAPLALKGTKQALYALADAVSPPAEKEQALQGLFINSLKSHDLKEAKQAFKEKRKPRFSGR